MARSVGTIWILREFVSGTSQNRTGGRSRFEAERRNEEIVVPGSRKEISGNSHHGRLDDDHGEELDLNARGKQSVIKVLYSCMK